MIGIPSGVVGRSPAQVSLMSVHPENIVAGKIFQPLDPARVGRGAELTHFERDP